METNMIIEDKLYGFKVVGVEPLEDAGGTLYSLCHEKHGTPLLFLDRDDSNKSFYIAFGTLPENDTGVFHIIEHSVLSGSEKFPVKEPFVELLKSSLRTFLNAMTYPDRTVYPVSSRCDKDFFNLVNVYLDAVFHPLMLENEFIFMQEGHRLELESKDAPITRNGVVFSEMKGAMSSPDELADEELTRLLYKGTVYSKNSGGDPDAIPTLTFEDFKAAHKKFYHPKEARIFLDGRVQLDRILPLIDSYLSSFDVRDEAAPMPVDVPTEPASVTVPYELGEDEPTENKTRISIGYKCSDFDATSEILMLSVLTDAIAGSNEAPLKKALLDSGLVEDASIYPLLDGVRKSSYAIELKNVKDGAEEELLSLLDRKLAELARDGIGREKLEASLNVREFRLREKDFGDMPKGLIFGLAMLDLWLYGDDPADAIRSEKPLRIANEALNGNAYEKLLEKYFINNNDKVTVTLKPDAALGEKRAAREQEELTRLKDSLDENALAALVEKTNAFLAWQASPDKDENLDTLPTLSLSDIPKESEWAPTEQWLEGDTNVIFHNIKTNGITYVEMFFDVSDLKEEELSYLTLLSSLLGKCDTAAYSAEKLSELKKSKLGAFYALPLSFTKDGTVTPYLKVFASALNKNLEDMTDILSEILNSTKFDDTSKIKTTLKQTVIAQRESFITSGHSAATRRASSYVTESGAIAECIFGIEAYRKMTEAERILEENPELIKEKLASLFRRCIARKRLTLGITGEKSDLANTLSYLPKRLGNTPIKRRIAPFGRKNEGFVIPSRVSYAARAADITPQGEHFTGAMHVLSNILSYTHLWENVRVKGGAYGAGFSVRMAGLTTAYSYRDPDPVATLSAIDSSWDFLRSLADEDEALDGFIIGAFGDYDSISTPRQLGTDATAFYLTGRTEADERRIRSEMLGIDKNELARLADILERAYADSGICIFGAKDSLETCKDLLKDIVEL